MILFVRRCSDFCFFTPTTFSFVSNAGNWSFSFKWTCYPCCYWCCCKRPRHPWCPNCCSLSASTFSRSKNWDASHFLKKIAFVFCSTYIISFCVRFMFTEVEELLELLLMDAALPLSHQMILQNLPLCANHFQR